MREKPRKSEKQRIQEHEIDLKTEGAKVFVEVLNFCMQSLPIISISPGEVPEEAFNIDQGYAINFLFFCCFATFSIVVSQRLKLPVIQ